MGAGPYDALLLVSFGGPEGPDDVVPFLENVTHGRGIPRERLLEVGEHYLARGGVSPINEQNRALLGAIRADLAAHGIDLPVYWGNRNWAPFLDDALREMAADGRRRALAFVTSAYSSYSGCRQYREDLAAACERVGTRAPTIEKLRPYFAHDGLVEPFVDATIAALESLPLAVRRDARIVCTTHSLPTSSAESSGPSGGAYVAQHRAVASDVAARVAARTGADRGWDLVFQSRSGPPTQPWLEPDVVDHLEGLHASGVPSAVLVPIGFVSDHMEVVHDLDTEALAAAGRLGLPVARAATPGVDARFVAMVRELVQERVTELSSGVEPASDGFCSTACCPNPRGQLAVVEGLS